MHGVDLQINAKYIVPVEPINTCHENHSILVDHGKIIDICPTENANTNYQAETVWDLPEHVLMPGFVNAHGHAAMSLFRGLADDLPLMTWLNEHIWPAEGKWVNENFVEDGVKLAMAEMLRSGTTCFSDMYFYPDIVARIAHDTKIRAQLAFPILDFPTSWARNSEEYISKGLQVHDDYRSHNNINLAFGPHAPYTVSDAPLAKIAMLSEELDMPVQIHLHETANEIEEALKNTGMRPSERLAKLGLMTPRLQCVHMTQIDESDIKLLSQSNAHIIHCPESNLKLASGFCPTHQLRNADINVALGTDGAASNNDLDMFSEMRTAALLAKAVANDASALPAFEALKMATLNGAKALGLDDQIGSLAKNKMADITAVKLSDIESLPIYDPISHLVYATSAQQVSHVWVNGEILLQDRIPTTLDLTEIKAAAIKWGHKIKTSDEAHYA